VHWQVREMVSVPPWDASVRVYISLAKYDNSYLPTMEEASPPSLCCSLLLPPNQGGLQVGLVWVMLSPLSCTNSSDPGVDPFVLGKTANRSMKEGSQTWHCAMVMFLVVCSFTGTWGFWPWTGA
jgi:hypothetical protein